MNNIHLPEDQRKLQELSPTYDHTITVREIVKVDKPKVVEVKESVEVKPSVVKTKVENKTTTKEI